MFRQTQKGFGEETVVDKQFDLPQFVSGSGPQFVSGSVPQFVSGSGPQFISGFHPISNTPLKDNNTHNVTTPWPVVLLGEASIHDSRIRRTSPQHDQVPPHQAKNKECSSL